MCEKSSLVLFFILNIFLNCSLLDRHRLLGDLRPLAQPPGASSVIQDGVC